MLGRRDSLLELIRAQREETREEHAETMAYLRQRDREAEAEFKHRDGNTAQTRANTQTVLSVLDRLEDAA